MWMYCQIGSNEISFSVAEIVSIAQMFQSFDLNTKCNLNIKIT